MLASASLVLLVLLLVLGVGSVVRSRRRAARLSGPTGPRREFFGDAIEAQHRASR